VLDVIVIKEHLRGVVVLTIILPIAFADVLVNVLIGFSINVPNKRALLLLASWASVACSLPLVWFKLISIIHFFLLYVGTSDTSDTTNDSFHGLMSQVSQMPAVNLFFDSCLDSLVKTEPCRSEIV
jgi:hypothetical protein